MAEGSHHVTRIPSIFDSDDDSDDEGPSIPSHSMGSIKQTVQVMKKPFPVQKEVFISRTGNDDMKVKEGKAALTVHKHDDVGEREDGDDDDDKDDDNDVGDSVKIVVKKKMELQNVVDDIKKINTAGDKATKIDTAGDKVTKIDTAGNMVSKMDTSGDKVTKIDTTGEKSTKIYTVGDKGTKMDTAGDKVTKIDTAGDKVDKIGTAGGKIIKIDTVGDKSIKIYTAGDKVTKIDTAGDRGTKIYTAGDKGTKMYAAGDKGTKIYSAGDKGTKIYTASDKGTKIHTASDKVTKIDTAGDKGTKIYSAGDKGTKIYSAGDKVTKIDTAADKGTKIYSAADKGTKIYTAGDKGTKIYTAGDKATKIDTAGDKATKIYTVGDKGVKIYATGDKGTKIYSAGDKGTKIDIAGDKATKIDTAGDKGTKIDTAGDKDTKIYTAGDKAAKIDTAGDKGTKIYTAGDKGTKIYTAGGKAAKIDTAGDKGTNIYTAGDKGTKIYTAGNKAAKIDPGGDKGTKIDLAGNKVTKIDAADDKAAKIDTSGDKGTKIDPAGDKVTKIYTAGDKTTKIDTAGDKATKIDTADDKGTKTYTAGDKVAKIDTAGDKGTKIYTAGDKVTRIDTVGDKGTKIDTAGEKVTKIDSTGDKVTKLSTAGDKATKINSAGDKVTKIDIAGDKVTKLYTAGDKATKIDTAGDKATKIDPAGDKSTKRDTAGDKVTKIDIPGDKATKLYTADDKATKIDTAGDKGTKIDPADDKSTKIDTAGDKVTKIDIAGDKATKLYTAGDESTKIDTAGDKITKIDTAGDKSTKKDTAGDKVTKIGTSVDKVAKVDTAGDKINKIDTADDKFNKISTAGVKLNKFDTAGDNVNKINTAGDMGSKINTADDKVMLDIATTVAVRDELENVIGSDDSEESVADDDNDDDLAESDSDPKDLDSSLNETIDEVDNEDENIRIISDKNNVRNISDCDDGNDHDNENEFDRDEDDNREQNADLLSSSLETETTEGDEIDDKKNDESTDILRAPEEHCVDDDNGESVDGEESDVDSLNDFSREEKKVEGISADSSEGNQSDDGSEAMDDVDSESASDELNSDANDVDGDEHDNDVSDSDEFQLIVDEGDNAARILLRKKAELEKSVKEVEKKGKICKEMKEVESCDPSDKVVVKKDVKKSEAKVESKPEVKEVENKTEDDDDRREEEQKKENKRDEKVSVVNTNGEESDDEVRSHPEDSDIESPVRMSTPRKAEDHSGSDTEDSTDSKILTMARKTVSSSAKGNVRVPTRVEDVYTDSEEEAEQEPPQKKTKLIKEDLILTSTSETESVDPEDQKDCVSLPSSSRAPSLEPPISVKGEPRKAPIVMVKVDVDQEISLPRGYSTRKIGKESTREDCMKAFVQGWRRQVVFRSMKDPSRGTRADIYYYAPNGRRLRSKVEIQDYLLRHSIMDLTLDNFSWKKESLGVESQYEEIRYATAKTMHSTHLVETTTSGESPVSTSPKPPKVSEPEPSSKPSDPERSEPSPLPTSASTPIPTPKASPEVPCSTSETQDPPRRKRGRPRKVRHVPLQEPSEKIARMETALVKRGRLRQLKAVNYSTAVKPSPVAFTISSSVSTNTVTGSIPSPSVSKSVSSSSQRASKENVRPSMPVGFNPKLVVLTSKVCEAPRIPLKILTPLLNKTASERTYHCTGTCERAQGLVPNLQCVKCLCLFHAECTEMPGGTIDLIQSGGARFLCPNCYRESKEKVEVNKWIPPTPYEPLAYDPPLDEQQQEDTQKPERDVNPKNYVRVNLRPETPPPSPESMMLDESIATSLADMASNQEMMHPNASLEQPVMMSNQVDPANMSGFVTLQPPGLPLGAPVAVNTSTGMLPVGAQLLQIRNPVSSATHFLVLRPTAPTDVTSAQPGNVGGMMGPQQLPSNVTPILPRRITQVGAPRAVYFPSSFMGGPSPIVLPGPVQKQQPQQLQQMQPLTQQPLLPRQQQPSQQQSQVLPKGSSMQNWWLPDAEGQGGQSSKPIASVPEKDVESMGNANFLRDVALSYRLLLRVFKYLSVKDLLVASQVCLMWRDMAYSPSLWVTVRLRNVCVRDWMEFAQFLQRRNTANVDLRKMVFYEVQDASSSSTKTSVASVKEVKRSRESSVQQMAKRKLSSTRSLESETKKNKQDKTDLEKEKSAKNQGDDAKKQKVERFDNADSPDDVDEKAPEKQDRRKESSEKSEDGKSSPTTQDKNVGKKLYFDTTGKLSLQELTFDATGNLVVKDRGCEKNTNRKDQDEEMEEAEVDKVTQEEEEEEDMTKISSQEESKTSQKGKPVSNTTSAGAGVSQADKAVKKSYNDIWREICSALGQVHSLRSVTLPVCSTTVLETLLSSCSHLTTVNASELRSQPRTANRAYSNGVARFDPAYLMETSNLQELRLGSSLGLELASNFNFIKLQHLKVLVLRGLHTTNWPYLGTQLTSLHVGPISKFTDRTWRNLGAMSNLKALWLEDGGVVQDVIVSEALGRLHKLRRLCLFNFVVGPKLGIAMKKLQRLERVFILPSHKDKDGSQNAIMLNAVQNLRHVQEFVWATPSQDIEVFNGIEYIRMCFNTTKISKEALDSSERVGNLWTLPWLEKVVQRYLPRTNVRILKLDSTAAARMAQATL